MSRRGLLGGKDTRNFGGLRLASRKRKKKAVRAPKSLLRGVALFVLLGVSLLAVDLAVSEIKTSSAQAKWFSSYASRIFFDMKAGAAPQSHYPKAGPYNERLGYTYLPYYFKALQAEGFEIAAQMRPSEAYDKLLGRGLYPIYRPKTVAGLTLYDRSGGKIYAASYPARVFASFEDVPPLLTRTLLHIENRELLQDVAPTKNPVIEWKRLLYALFSQSLHKIIPQVKAGGGSTLATQIEKFRFSPQGLTGSAAEKIRQILSATFRVYLDGMDTREARKRILLDYLNSTPLSARAGFGEINSIGDGLWAWFGIDLEEARSAFRLSEDDPSALQKKAEVYRAALALILAQRRPSSYLHSERDALENLIDGTLDLLLESKIISKSLHDAANKARLTFVAEAPPPSEPAYLEQKAVNFARAHLMNQLGLKRLYEVDRLDLSAQTTLDSGAQKKLAAFLKNMGDQSFLEANGLYGSHLLEPGNDPSKIKWSVVLYERGARSHKIRLQADNIEGPFDMNEGMKLDLGSTAKLRTLVTYMEIIAELHRRYAGLDPETLEEMRQDAPNALTVWGIEWLKTHPDADLDAMLEASLERRYSANPQEIFFTGGGQHVFHNFKREEDLEIMDIREAFRRSVNLVFIRMMRDIVNYTISQGPQTKEELLKDDEEQAVARRAYLERFAEQEGGVFLGRYLSDYEKLEPAARMEKILGRARKGAMAATVIFRSVMPEADFASYEKFLDSHTAFAAVPAARRAKLYKDYAPQRYSLADRAYLSRVNPIELWLVAYLAQNPNASRREIMDSSRAVRLASYEWLFKNSKKHAQDTRIRMMLEEDAFAHIQKRWERLGYPFKRLVPSFATAIGSSADRPGALAELAGLLLSDGQRLPIERFSALEFAAGTPYQTMLEFKPPEKPQQVLSPSIARVVRKLMGEVVEQGTARRARGVYKDSDGRPLAVGGKTGTGDHRYEEFAAGGRLLSSRVVNRTGTFVFYIGENFFGTITAHVAGEDAEKYVFTSALSAQMLSALAPIINPVVNAAASPDAEDLTPLREFTQPLPPL